MFIAQFFKASSLKKKLDDKFYSLGARMCWKNAKKKVKRNVKKYFVSFLNKSVTHVSTFIWGLLKIHICSFVTKNFRAILDFFWHRLDFLPPCTLPYALNQTIKNPPACLGLRSFWLEKITIFLIKILFSLGQFFPMQIFSMKLIHR